MTIRLSLEITRNCLQTHQYTHSKVDQGYGPWCCVLEHVWGSRKRTGCVDDWLVTGRARVGPG
jgi:hypothetical protein